MNRYDTGTIGGILAMKYWDRTFSTGFRDSFGNLNITASQSATIVSILSAGTFFGALTAAPVADFIGRRLGLIVSTIVFVFGVALQTAATAIPLFVAGRFFAGFGVGLISAMSEWIKRLETEISIDLQGQFLSINPKLLQSGSVVLSLAHISWLSQSGFCLLQSSIMRHTIVTTLVHIAFLLLFNLPGPFF
jgi:MFS family permease